jgi:hypothetical protein
MPGMLGNPMQHLVMDPKHSQTARQVSFTVAQSPCIAAGIVKVILQTKGIHCHVHAGLAIGAGSVAESGSTKPCDFSGSLLLPPLGVGSHSGEAASVDPA